METIEDVVAGRGADLVIGSGADNRIRGYSSDDTILGDSGSDTAVYLGSKTDFVIQRHDAYWIVEDSRATELNEGRDRLESIEQLQFLDQVVNLEENRTLEGDLTFVGALIQGNNLVVENSFSDPDGFSSQQYQWYRDNLAIEGATNAEYRLERSDIGSSISVGIVYTDGVGIVESRRSESSGPVESAESEIYAWNSHQRPNALLHGDDVEYSLPLGNNEMGCVISASVALAALIIAVVIKPNPDEVEVSPYQLIAADVNEDERVSAAGALSILKMAVNLDGSPEREWILVDDRIDLYDDDNQSFMLNRGNVDWELISEKQGGNLVAVLKGGVNASWEGDIKLPQLPETYFTDLADLAVAPLIQWWIA